MAVPVSDLKFPEEILKHTKTFPDVQRKEFVENVRKFKEQSKGCICRVGSSAQEKLDPASKEIFLHISNVLQNTGKQELVDLFKKWADQYLGATAAVPPQQSAGGTVASIEISAPNVQKPVSQTFIPTAAAEKNYVITDDVLHKVGIGNPSEHVQAFPFSTRPFSYLLSELKPQSTTSSAQKVRHLPDRKSNDSPRNNCKKISEILNLKSDSADQIKKPLYDHSSHAVPRSVLQDSFLSADSQSQREANLFHDVLELRARQYEQKQKTPGPSDRSQRRDHVKSASVGGSRKDWKSGDGIKLHCFDDWDEAYKLRREQLNRASESGSSDPQRTIDEPFRTSILVAREIAKVRHDFFKDDIAQLLDKVRQDLETAQGVNSDFKVQADKARQAAGGGFEADAGDAGSFSCACEDDGKLKEVVRCLNSTQQLAACCLEYSRSSAAETVAALLDPAVDQTRRDRFARRLGSLARAWTHLLHVSRFRRNEPLDPALLAEFRQREQQARDAHAQLNALRREAARDAERVEAHRRRVAAVRERRLADAPFELALRATRRVCRAREQRREWLAGAAATLRGADLEAAQRIGSESDPAKLMSKASQAVLKMTAEELASDLQALVQLMPSPTTAGARALMMSVLASRHESRREAAEALLRVAAGLGPDEQAGLLATAVALCVARCAAVLPHHGGRAVAAWREREAFCPVGLPCEMASDCKRVPLAATPRWHGRVRVQMAARPATEAAPGLDACPAPPPSERVGLWILPAAVGRWRRGAAAGGGNGTASPLLPGFEFDCLPVERPPATRTHARTHTHTHTHTSLPPPPRSKWQALASLLWPVY